MGGKDRSGGEFGVWSLWFVVGQAQELSLLILDSQISVYIFLLSAYLILIIVRCVF